MGSMDWSTVSPRQGVLALAAALPLYLVLRTVYRLFFAPLRDIPGPFLARVSRAWKFKHACAGDITDALDKLHAKYGALVRIGPDEVSVRSAADISKIYADKEFRKEKGYYETWSARTKSERNPGHFPTIDPEVHAKYKRPVAHVYSIRNILTYEELMEDSVLRLQAKLDTTAETGERMDIGEYLHFFAYDIVGELAFGEDFGFLKQRKDVGGLIDLLNRMVKWRHAIAQVPHLRPLLDTRLGKPLFNALATYWGHERESMDLMGLAAGRVMDRLKEIKEGTYKGRGDMLDTFIAAKDPDAPGQTLSPFAVIVEAMDMLGAGSDTTATALRSSLRFLMDHPDALSRVRREIDDALSAGLVQFPLTYNSAVKLLYTQACIKEAMRLGPSVGATVPRTVPRDGAVIADRFFAAGSTVGMSPRVVHTDPAAFGPDAALFKPERWLDGDKAQLEKNLLTFGGGSRVCIGRNVSIVEIAKLIPTLVWFYDFEYATKEKMVFWQGWFNVQTGFTVYVKKRDL